MAASLDWHTLAISQRQQLEAKDAAITGLKQQVSQYSQQVANLQFQVAEQAEQLANAVPRERYTKLELQVQVLCDRDDELKDKATSADSRLEGTFRRFSKENGELNEQISTLRAQLDAPKEAPTANANVQGLRDALALSEAETADAKRQIARLMKQLQAEKQSNAKTQGHPTYDPAKCDMDDEEYVEGRPRFENKEQLLPTFQSPFPQPPMLSKPSLTVKLPLHPKPRLPATPKTARKPFPNSAGPQAKQKATKTRRVASESPQKRKRSSDDIDENELNELRLQGFQPATSKRRRSNMSMSEEDEEDGIPKLRFNAVTSWRSDGSLGEGYPHEDLNAMGELWDQIHVVQDMWEDAAGPFWQHDFAKTGKKSGTAQCVTKKLCGGKELSDGIQLGGGRTQWRKGFEGKAACRDCVAHRWPCFTWYEADGGELLLLPLHEQDRKKKVANQFEIRHWLNA